MSGVVLSNGGISTVTPDGTTITGNGTPGSPLVGHSTVSADGTTITGNGTSGNPLIAHPTVSADGTTITGNGSSGNPLIAHPTVSVDGTTITGNGSSGNPLISHGLTTVSVDGTTITGDGTSGNPLIASPASGLYINVKNSPYNAVGDGSTDDRTAIGSALTAAVAAGGGTIYFPPGIYSVSRSGSNSWCLDITGSNIRLLGEKGASWIRAQSGLPNAAVAVVRINEKSNVVLENMGIDGNWGNALTFIASGSNKLTLPQSTINVVSTTSYGATFPSSGTISIATDVGLETITYTGKTGTTFTGCTGGTGTLITDQAVGQQDSQAGINHTTQSDPKNYGLWIRGSSNIVVESCLFQQIYGDGTWLGQGATDFSQFSNNVSINRCSYAVCARDGIAMAQKCRRIRITGNDVRYTYADTIDTEPVGTSYGVQDIVVANNYVGTWWGRDNPARSANLAMTIAGGYSNANTEEDVARNYRVYGNTFEGPLLIENGIDIAIWGNRFVLDWAGNSYAPIHITQTADDIKIFDNFIYKRTGNIAACIVVSYYASGTLNNQPRGVQVHNNTIHARNSNHGISVNGQGGTEFSGGLVTEETGTATGVSTVTVTDSGKSWATNKYSGFLVHLGDAVGTIATNTATTFTVTRWSFPMGALHKDPAAGAYVITAGGGVLDIDNNHIDCSNDGVGGGINGISVSADRVGSRIRIRGNTIKNANGAAINIDSSGRTMISLAITNNHAWDNQSTPTTTPIVAFNTSSNISKLILHGNTSDSNITSTTGLTSGVWLVGDGHVQQWAGYGYPNGIITANIGSTFNRRDAGGARALWLKQTDEGLNTGWVGLTSPPVLPWTVDAGSGIGIPQNTTEWSAVISAAGLSVATPSSIWLMQEASGSLADTVGAATLAASGTGLSYQQTLSAWASKAVATTENVSGRWDSTDASLPDTGTGAITLCTYAKIATNANVNRMLMGVGTTQAYIGGATATRVASGANVTTASGSQYGQVRPYVIRHDHSGTSTTGFEDQNKITPTYSSSVTGKLVTIGGLSGIVNPSSNLYLYAWAWYSAIADADLKKILQVLGWVIDWT